MVARLGGDEFGVLMWHLEPARAAPKARELEAVIETVRVAHGAAQLSVGASAGIAALAADAAAAAVIDCADRAMYARKKERRG
jgi:diguanylate cyclase (GGDEF)-like protein